MSAITQHPDELTGPGIAIDTGGVDTTLVTRTPDAPRSRRVVLAGAAIATITLQMGALAYVMQPFEDDSRLADSGLSQTTTPDESETLAARTSKAGTAQGFDQVPAETARTETARTETVRAETADVTPRAIESEAKAAPAADPADADVRSVVAATGRPLLDAADIEVEAPATAHDDTEVIATADPPAYVVKVEAPAPADATVAAAGSEPGEPEVAPAPPLLVETQAFFPRPPTRPAHLQRVARAAVVPARHTPQPRAVKLRSMRNVSATSADLADAGWIMEQPVEYFTLQMVSLSDGSRFRKFSRGVPASEYMAHVRVLKAGGIRHVLYRGVYADRASAESDAGALAARTGVKPWIRRIGDVRREVDRGV